MHRLERWILAMAIGCASWRCQGEAGLALSEAPDDAAGALTGRSAGAERLVRSSDELASAVIRVESAGQLLEPDGRSSRRQTGAGFIVGPSGRAITSSRLVNGVGYVTARLGDGSPEVSARVVGISECHDLAIIDLEGDGYSYLSWSRRDVEAALPVRVASPVAGRGVRVSEHGRTLGEAAPAHTPWASANRVVTHDVEVSPDDVGAPLLDDALDVAGVQLGVDDASGESLALATSAAREVADALDLQRFQADAELLETSSVDSLGINGVAIDDGERRGVWVRAVRASSPADVAGVAPGDLIVSLAGEPLAERGTLREYCSIIATHTDQGVMAVEVERAGQRLAGQINGAPLGESSGEGAAPPRRAPDAPASGCVTASPNAVLLDDLETGRLEHDATNKRRLAVDLVNGAEPDGPERGLWYAGFVRLVDVAAPGCGNRHAMRLESQARETFGINFRISYTSGYVDLRGYRAIRFWARAPQGRVALRVAFVDIVADPEWVQLASEQPPGPRCNPDQPSEGACSDTFGADLGELGPAWRAYEVAFADVERDPQRRSQPGPDVVGLNLQHMRSMAWEVTPQGDEAYQVDVDGVELLAY